MVAVERGSKRAAEPNATALAARHRDEILLDQRALLDVQVRARRHLVELARPLDRGVIGGHRRAMAVAALPDHHCAALLELRELDVTALGVDRRRERRRHPAGAG